MRVKIDEYQDGVYYARIETGKSDFKKLMDDFILYESNEDIYKLKRRLDKICKERGME